MADDPERADDPTGGGPAGDAAEADDAAGPSSDGSGADSTSGENEADDADAESWVPEPSAEIETVSFEDDAETTDDAGADSDDAGADSDDAGAADEESGADEWWNADWDGSSMSDAESLVDDPDAGETTDAAPDDAGTDAGETTDADATSEAPSVPDDGVPDEADASDAADGHATDATDAYATDGDGATATGAAAVDPEAPVVDETATGSTDYAYSYGDDDWDVGSGGPDSDVEMPLTEHIEEMVRRLAVVFAVGGLITLLLFPGADLANAYLGTELISATDVINHLWDKHIPGTTANPERRPRLYGPLELLMTELKVAGLGGLIVGLPVLVYETYLFMRPGLYPNERRYYLMAVPTSVVLAAIGVAFAHFAVLPAIFAYFTSYTTGTAIVAFGLRETFNLILILMGYMAIVFQIPLFIMLAIMMDLVTADWLRERRLIFWGAFLGLSFIATPDPTGMAPIIVGATMIVLFEGTLGVLKYTTGRSRS
jgi:sec-independent protein translocase protein TatC